MERVIERLELDRDMLNHEMHVLGDEIGSLEGDMAEIKEDLEDQNEELEALIAALKTMNKLAKGNPNLWPAKRPVCLSIMDRSESTARLEEELKNKTALLEEKNDLLEDKLKDRNHIDAYLRVNARAAEYNALKEKGELEALTDEDVVAIADILTTEHEKDPAEEKMVG